MINAVAAAEKIDDEELVRRARERDEAAVPCHYARYNRRLFRVARSILRDDAEGRRRRAGDLCPRLHRTRAFFAATRHSALDYAHRDERALGRLRKRHPTVDWSTIRRKSHASRDHRFPIPPPATIRSEQWRKAKFERFLEHAIDELPDAFRAVSSRASSKACRSEETADLFGLQAETVKTRLHRARNLLRDALDKQLGPALTHHVPFDGAAANADRTGR